MSETKSELIQLRITPTDKDVIKANALAEGISMSKYIVREATRNVANVVPQNAQVVNPTASETEPEAYDTSLEEAEAVETAVVEAETSEA
jgi:uncharacterized protein (DUF1778 family)